MTTIVADRGAGLVSSRVAGCAGPLADLHLAWNMKRLGAYAEGHGRAVASIRFGVGVWLLGLGAYLCSREVWWGLLFIAPATLHFYLGYRAMK